VVEAEAEVVNVEVVEANVEVVEEKEAEEIVVVGEEAEAVEEVDLTMMIIRTSLHKKKGVMVADLEIEEALVTEEASSSQIRLAKSLGSRRKFRMTQ